MECTFFEAHEKSSKPKAILNRDSKWQMIAGTPVGPGDTGLLAQVEKDYTVYGDECKFGGGKTLREGMGQSSTATTLF